MKKVLAALIVSVMVLGLAGVSFADWPEKNS